MKDLLVDLENEALRLLDGKMNPFVKSNKPGGVIACPWLNWRKDYPDATPGKIQGIFIMQDWYCSSNSTDSLKKSQEESLEYNVNYIREACKVNDATIHNLYNLKKWKPLIWDNKKTWLVTNAVWGLRTCDNPTGPLPVNLHKTAFQVWSQLVAKFAIMDDFKVMFAGAWSADPEERKCGQPLGSFLESWRKWAGKGIGKNVEVSKLCFKDVKGKAFFCSHPATWTRKSKYKVCHCDECRLLD
jgi:hypothetical protein